MLELLCLKSEMARVGFCWHSWLLLKSNMRWHQLIRYITSSQLAYLMVNVMSQILKMMWWMSSNHSSVANLKRTGNLRPNMHFEVIGLKNHNSTTFRYTSESPSYVMSLVRTDQALEICQSQLAMNVANTGLSWRWVSYGRSRDDLYGQSGGVTNGRWWRLLAWLETEMPCMAGDGDVSYGHRWWCLGLPE